MGKGYVYCIKHKGLTPLKIGITKSPQGRLKQLETCAPYGVEVVFCFLTESPEKYESIIHRELKEYRLKGEWFEIDEFQLMFVFKKYGEKVVSEMKQIDAKKTNKTIREIREIAVKKEQVEAFSLLAFDILNISMQADITKKEVLELYNISKDLNFIAKKDSIPKDVIKCIINSTRN